MPSVRYRLKAAVAALAVHWNVGVEANVGVSGLCGVADKKAAVLVTAKQRAWLQLAGLPSG